MENIVKNLCLYAFVFIMFFLVFTVAATAEEEKNQVTFYPSFGLGGFTSSPSIPNDIVGFAGIGVEYLYFFYPWLGFGIEPSISIGGIGSEDIGVEVRLVLYTELRPFAGLRQLYFRSFLEQFAFVVPLPEGTTRSELTWFSGGITAGYYFRITDRLRLNTNIGARLLYAPSQLSIQMVADIGFTIPF